LTDEELAGHAADLVLKHIGPAVAEVLDMQMKEAGGGSLRDHLYRQELEKIIAARKAKEERKNSERQAKEARDAQAEKEVLDGWNDTYILTVGGQRIKKVPKDLSKLGCPHCGAPHVRLRGALLELWEWRNNHSGPGASIYEAPVRSESLVCQKCGQAFAYRAQVLL